MIRAVQIIATALLAYTVSAPAQHAGADTASAGGKNVATGPSLDWDRAFTDRSGNTPIHFVASYVDPHGQTHRLEEWRTGTTHLRRLTDARIDLHADAAGHPLPGQPADYIWQVLDLKTRIDHRVSTAGMLRLGMLYSYYGMAHGLTRPTGQFTLHTVPGLQPATWHNQPTAWFQISSTGQPAMRVCWLRSAGLPLRILQQTATGWAETFTLQQLETTPIAPSVFAVTTTGFQVRNVDEAAADD